MKTSWSAGLLILFLALSAPAQMALLPVLEYLPWDQASPGRGQDEFWRLDPKAKRVGGYAVPIYYGESLPRAFIILGVVGLRDVPSRMLGLEALKHKSLTMLAKEAKSHRADAILITRWEYSARWKFVLAAKAVKWKTSSLPAQR